VSSPDAGAPTPGAGPTADAPKARRLERPLRRSEDDRVLGGVCGGLAARLAVSPTLVRVVAVVSIALGGAGLLAYMGIWVLVPAVGEDDSIASRVIGDRRELQIVLAFSTALLAALLLTRAFGVNDLGLPALSVLACAVGVLVVWRGASPAELARMRDRLNAAPGFQAGSPKSWRRVALRVAVGVVLILVGVSYLSRMGNLQGAAFGVLVGAVLFVGGFLVLFAPWWARTLRDLSTERRERVRAQERADMAAHVHDSVLQTLSLIQKSAGDPREVVRLARMEERELRHWLFDPARLGRHGDRPETLDDALAAIEREVEDSYGIGVELIVVGDCPMDEAVGALVGACREATVNAAKWSGCTEVSLFVEVESDTVSAYVRDLGVGFEPALVPTDRQGIACSMVDRMGRQGGTVSVTSAPGTGTEVELVLPRTSPAP
jgi:signal transduction histidine kinase